MQLRRSIFINLINTLQQTRELYIEVVLINEFIIGNYDKYRTLCF